VNALEKRKRSSWLDACGGSDNLGSLFGQGCTVVAEMRALSRDVLGEGKTAELCSRFQSWGLNGRTAGEEGAVVVVIVVRTAEESEMQR
jgi:hypothetical protein